MKKIHILKVLIMIFLGFWSQYAFSETLSSSKNGVFSFSNDNNILIHSTYIGWAKNWKWDQPIINELTATNNKKEIKLHFRKQDVKSHVLVEKNRSSIKYSYIHTFNKSLSSTIGGGIEFKLDLLSQRQKYGAKDPKLLPNNTGWIWAFTLNKTIEIIFPPNTVKIHFERGDKSKIRIMFFSGNIKKGISRITTMNVKVPSSTIIKPFNVSSTEKKISHWLKQSLNSEKSFIDLSYLNDKPAGKRGFVKAVGDSFKFSDDSPAIFFGANVQAYSLFSKNKNIIKRHAKRLASLGFNLVRLHHHDSPWVNPSLISKGSTSQQINQSALDSYFWWVKCLRDEGIYVWVDLQVQRPWREGDKIPGWETDMAPKSKKGMNVGKGFIYLNKRMQELTKKFNKELLTKINPYTHLALKDDPAVMGLMITNENDITHHFGNVFLKDKNHPYHQSLFDEEVEQFSEKFNLRAYKVRETWKPGLSKYLLNDLEARFNKNMIKYLHELGVKVPITTTSLWGRNSALFSLPALTTGDMVDTHGYADDGIFKKGQLKKNPRYDSNFLPWIGQAQVLNKPFTITEYNVGERSDIDNAYIPTILIASMAAFQGWDAIMLYGYSQDDLKGGSVSPWSSYTHPAIMGVIPAMALLYREGHVARAKKTVVIAPINDDLFTKNLSPKTSITIRTTLEQHRMAVAMPKTKILPWLSPSTIPKNAIVVHDLSKNMLPVNQDFIESDTGEIKRNWRKGIMTVNTDNTQLAMGKIGGHKIVLNNVILDSKTPEAAIIFSSLDKKPLSSSSRILISAVAKVAKVKKQWKNSYISEPVDAKIIFSSVHKNLNLVVLRSNGREGKSLVLHSDGNGKYSFILSDKDNTHWYILKNNLLFK